MVVCDRVRMGKRRIDDGARFNTRTQVPSVIVRAPTTQSEFASGGVSLLGGVPVCHSMYLVDFACAHIQHVDIANSHRRHEAYSSSLAILDYELAANARPYDGSTRTGVNFKHRAASERPLRTSSPDTVTRAPISVLHDAGRYRRFRSAHE